MSVKDEQRTKWIDEMVVELRLRDVRGSAIGDAVAAVEGHCAESGESAREAFGDPREYARSLAVPPSQLGSTTPTEWARVLAPVLAGVVGLGLATSVAPAARRGTGVQVTWGDLLSLVALLAFVALTMRVLRAVLQHRVGGALYLGGAVTVLSVLPLLVRAPAASLPLWLAAVITVVLLAWSVVGLARGSREWADPVVDPMTGADRYQATPHPALARLAPLASWAFVIAAVVLGALAWSTA